MVYALGTRGAAYVLHAFKKTTQEASARNLELARTLADACSLAAEFFIPAIELRSLVNTIELPKLFHDAGWTPLPTGTQHRSIKKRVRRATGERCNLSLACQ